MPTTTEKAEETKISKELKNKLDRYDVKLREYRMLKNSFATETDENYLIKMVINNSINKNIGEGRFDDAIKQYECLATFIASEERKNPLETLRSLNTTKLKKFYSQGYTHVTIETCGDGGCLDCRKLNKRKLEVAKAMETMPLPNIKCKFDLYRNGYSFCRCSYIPAYGPRARIKESIEVKKYVFLGLIITFLYFLYYIILKWTSNKKLQKNE